jgi:hypothetical protein
MVDVECPSSSASLTMVAGASKRTSAYVSPFRRGEVVGVGHGLKLPVRRPEGSVEFAVAKRTVAFEIRLPRLRR